MTSSAEHFVTSGWIRTARLWRTNVLTAEATVTLLTHVHPERMDRTLIAAAEHLIRFVGALSDAITTLMRRNALLVGSTMERWRMASLTTLFVLVVSAIRKTITTALIIVAVLRATVLFVRTIQAITMAITNSASMNTSAFVFAFN